MSKVLKKDYILTFFEKKKCPRITKKCLSNNICVSTSFYTLFLTRELKDCQRHTSFPTKFPEKLVKLLIMSIWNVTALPFLRNNFQSLTDLVHLAAVIKHELCEFRGFLETWLPGEILFDGFAEMNKLPNWFFKNCYLFKKLFQNSIKNGSHLKLFIIKNFTIDNFMITIEWPNLFNIWYVVLSVCEEIQHIF